MQIVDVSDPMAPTRTGWYDTIGSARDVAQGGWYAYVADHDAGLDILDVANPAVPKWLGEYYTWGLRFGVVVSGRFAYVADYDKFQVIGVSDLRAPVRVFTDINAFVPALSDPGRYLVQYAQCDLMNADCDDNGQIDVSNIRPFVKVLAGE